MSHDAVKPRVVLDTREIPVMLNSDQRITLEDLRRERVVTRAERLGVERRVISLEKHLDDVEDR